MHVLDNFLDSNFKMQGTIVMPDEHLQSSTPPPNKSSDPQNNMDVSPKSTLETKEFTVNQSNQSDSGILSATGTSTYTEMDVTNRSENEDTDNRSSCSSPDRKFQCSICDTVLTSQHEFTLHIRSHNNDSEAQINEKGFVCRICFKVLSSAASLDRHMLIHSGERPFPCKYCGDTFTTNGNMHRHMRTHTNKTNYESDGSSDSGASCSSKTVEYNNNKVIPKIDSNIGYLNKKRVCIDENKNNKRIKMQVDSHDSSQTYTCPVCRRDDFNSTDILEIHLEDNHPDYPVNCNICSKSFKNLKVLREHKYTTHDKHGSKHHRNSVLGFQDLTFVDFSSQKFPLIAKYECEKKLHKAATAPKFQCNKCSRAFPCSMSLEIHISDCTASLDLSTKSKSSSSGEADSDKDIYRNDFFARLDLQSKLQKSESAREDRPLPYGASLLPPAETKDLADIQSIISNTTNGSLLQQLQAKSTDVNSIKQESDLENSRNENDEESQDLFATEFRKMKIRGEFPCRLCRAVFPNLRALKGHNRSHLNGINNGMYLCNMCPHSSLDKAALIRHMRNHNGDRPYECSLCKYAFTTKANCERHLKNRHAKNTREEVKKAIIYHPSEDPSNEEISKMLSSEDTTKPLLLSNTPKPPTKPTDNKLRIMSPSITNLLGASPSKNSISSEQFNNNFNSEASFPRIYPGNEVVAKENLHLPKILASYSPQFNFYPKHENTSTPQKALPKINVKNIESLITPEQETNKDAIGSDSESVECDDQPMDLVLDLSKKKSEPIQSYPDISADSAAADHPQDLSKKNPEILMPPQNDFLAQSLLKNNSKLDPAALYASQVALYRSGFHQLHPLNPWAFPINPLFLQSMSSSLLPQDPDMKERLRAHLRSGGMIMDNQASFAERLKNYQHSLHINALNNYKANEVQQSMHDINYLHRTNKSDDVAPLSLSVDPNLSENIASMQSPGAMPKSESIATPNSVKMIIKNGVLMPKQKQRRYRTERPFSCEYCSAKFTLRSNMERHIKQQHPQYWQQRHKASMGAGRKPQSSSTNQKQGFCNINIPNYDTPRRQEYDESKDNQISDKVKYAILAQQLKDTQNFKASIKSEVKIKEEDEEVPLIIDENNESANKIEDSVDQRINDHFSEKSKQYAEMHANLTFNAIKNEEAQDLVPVARLLDNASQQPFKKYFHREVDGREGGVSEEDEEGLVASGSTSEENNSGTDENRSESENTVLPTPVKKKSAYSLAPNRVICPYCKRKFPWTSSLRRHVLTHTGQKPYKCSHCSLLFTTKSNCDRHLLRKHGNAASVINTNDQSTGSSNFMMRNVPDRPYKCPTCPSSTFATNSNLRKHMSSKHSLQGAHDDAQVSPGYEAGSSEDEKLSLGERKSEWEKQISPNAKLLPYPNADPQNMHLQNSDLPFKCHLCDNSFGERHDALDHIKDKHNSEYELLLSKNALDVNATTPDDNPHHEDNDESEVRGKFPDYANRKVICAFCMRRFWSAEDLRRHMRTHTGERPFSCDVCHRRFTLKHSMLRHRKKHSFHENDQINSDEDNCVNVSSSYNGNNNNNMERKSPEKTEESDGTESDLISNLLGIRDPSLIEQVLISSADDAAKLLGVNSREAE